MRAAVVTRERGLEIRDIPEPEAGPYGCLVEIDACAICTGTDSNIIRANFPGLPDPPFVLGHESTGIIRELGEKVGNFSIGQRVTRPAGVLPGERRSGIASVWGGFSELGIVVDTEAAVRDGVRYSSMAESSRRALPPEVGPVWGALSINQREIMSVVERLKVGLESRCVVIGSGYNGLLFSLLLKRREAGRVLMVGSESRRELATGTYGADRYLDYRRDHVPSEVRDLLEGEPTVVIDAVGTRASVLFGESISGPGTAFGKYGMHEYDLTEEPLARIGREHEILDLTTDEASATDEWLRLYRQDFFTDDMFDGTVPLEEIGLAFERLARREAVKLVVTI